jgi:hypothetical protein
MLDSFLERSARVISLRLNPPIPLPYFVQAASFAKFILKTKISRDRVSPAMPEARKNTCYAFRMNLMNLPKETLLEKTDFLAREERRITVQLIEHLREIERRMLYAELGYGSLHDFCVKRLGLSEGSAQRRIQAMRLARELPEVKEAILEGSISLTNAAKLQTAFQAEKKLAREAGRDSLDVAMKREVLQELSGLTQRECEAKLCEVLPEASLEMNRERVRRIGSDSHEIRLVVADAFLKKLDRIRELLSHAVPAGSAMDIFERLMAAEIDRLEKKKGVKSNIGDTEALDVSELNSVASASLKQVSVAPPNSAAKYVGISPAPAQDESTSTGTVPVPNRIKRSVFPKHGRRAIPVSVRRAIWERARGRCETPGCQSRFRLEIDHILPVAHGGGDEIENLRLLCRTHNRAEAKARVGAEKMRPYVSALRSG